MDTRPAQDEVSAAEVLNFIARGLGSLPHRIGRLEALAAPLALAAPQDAGLRVALQDLDHIRQTVEDLARLSTAAGQDDTRDLMALAATLRLEALRDVFPRSGATSQHHPKPSPHTGRVELFADGADGN